MTMWYAVHDEAGRLQSVGTTLADQMPEGWAVVVLAGEPDLVLQQWDEDERAFVARPEPARWIDPFDFVSRLDIPTEAAIRAAARADSTIETFLARLTSPALRRVVVDDPVLLAGLQYLRDHNLLTEQQIQGLLA